jgi:predicted nucleic acid-binding protein
VIVLDSSFPIGFHNERDAHHQAALTLMDRFLAGEWGKGLLLEYIFLEIVTVLLVRRDHAVATRVGPPGYAPRLRLRAGTRLSLADAGLRINPS